MGKRKYTWGPTLEKQLSRFEADPNSGCWLWSGSLGGGGRYGVLVIEGKDVLAHRASYSRAFGPIAPGLCVCHQCDTPLCINPGHLFLGTHAENMRDCRLKGRFARRTGESHTQSKVTVEDVIRIRADTRSTREISKDYGIHYASISRIKSRKNWSHVP